MNQEFEVVYSEKSKEIKFFVDPGSASGITVFKGVNQTSRFDKKDLKRALDAVVNYYESVGYKVHVAPPLREEIDS